MKKVYIAGPYSKGDVAENVRNAMAYANMIIELGHAPFCPHLSHFQHMHSQHPYETWMKIDEEFLKCCDVVWRIPGESKGADYEVHLAVTLGIPIAHGHRQICKFLRGEEMREDSACLS